MINKSPEAQQFEKDLTTKIDAFSFSRTTEETNTGKRWMIRRAQKSIEGYRQTTLSSPDVLVNLLHSIRLLPPELIHLAVEQMMKQIIDRLKVTAQVTFDPKSRDLAVAGYEVAKIKPHHVSALQHLMTRPRGQMVSVEEFIEVVLKKNPAIEEFSMADAYNEVLQLLAGLESFLSEINITAGMPDMPAVYPLRLIRESLEQEDNQGNSYSTLGYTVWSDFLLDPPVESVVKGEVRIDLVTGVFSFNNETIGGLDPEERNILTILLAAPQNQPVRVKELAARLGEDWEVTWTRLGRLEEMLQSTSQTLFKGEQSLLSLNIGAHPIKTKSKHDPADPTVFVTSSFPIAI